MQTQSRRRPAGTRSHPREDAVLGEGGDHATVIAGCLAAAATLSPHAGPSVVDEQARELYRLATAKPWQRG